VKYFVILTSMLYLSLAQAQEDADSAGVAQFGAFVGNTLPNGIDGAEEIFPLWGARYSHPVSKTGFVDISAFAGNSEGVDWKALAAGISMQIPIETLIGHVGIGLDYTRYSTSEVETTNEAGAHFIGGAMTSIGGNVLARFDMKLNSKPGTSLYFAVGFVFALGGGDGAAEP